MAPIQMDEDSLKALIKDITKEVVQEVTTNPSWPTSTMDPETHRKQHEAIGGLLAYLDDAKKTAFTTLVGAFMLFIIGCFALGFYNTYHK